MINKIFLIQALHTKKTNLFTFSISRNIKNSITYHMSMDPQIF